jgi:CHAD domain-containing protein/HD superfamily phosphodiesterase
MNTPAKTTGLRYWMLRVLEECENVATDFRTDPVHDLRVALRRCRSLADGMIAMDPDHDWKAMKKAGKNVFQRLGALRDVQIMLQWIETLDIPKTNAIKLASDRSVDSGDPDLGGPSQPGASTDSSATPIDPAKALLDILKTREIEGKREAQAALEEFDRKQWRQWAKSLPPRTTRTRPGSAVFKHLALERWMAAQDMHVRAMRNRSQVALHTLRIGIKRFRYIVENFLPEQHKLWSNDLKHMQDLLGEVHDLDVLWATALSCHIFPDDLSRKTWHDRIVEERSKRVYEYRGRTTGPESLWNLWRAALPQDKQIHEIATRRLKLWAKALDPDFAHSERVARLSLELYDGLLACGFGSRTSPTSSSNNTDSDLRQSLYAASLLHDVGKAKGNKGHHKRSSELIKKHGTPLGWKPGTLDRAAIIARFHCGGLPTRSHKALRDLLSDEQKNIIRLSAILRLANALDVSHDGHIRRVKIENAVSGQHRTNGFLTKPTPLGKNEALVISAEGYADGTPTAQALAAERYLLESVLRRPVLVKPASGAQRRARPQRSTLKA